MAKALISLVILSSLLCKFTVGTGRTTDLSAAINATAPAAAPFALSLGDDEDGGICDLLVTNQGYICEEHTVTTSDGYILSLQRIPVGISGGITPGKRTPVLLQHGVLMDGMTWLLLPPSQALAFVLADNGYDVWIANSRGTKYSRGHVSLTTDDKDYWNWSWDELVNYDLPATVDYVHNQTGEKLHYIGHSQGTLIALASLSKGLLMDKLRSATLLCPIAYLGQMNSFLARVGVDLFIAKELYWLDFKEFNPKGIDVANLLHNICNVPGVDCGDLMTAITGQNCCLQSSTVDLFLKYEPQPTSTKNMIHFAQMARRGTLAMYDYDDEYENMNHYGQPSPPEYSMTTIPDDFPLFFSYGGTDTLSDKSDVRILLDVLKGRDDSNGKFMTQYVNNYAHADYVMADAAKEEVYDLVLTFLKLH
ncbi:unnamed protein product [Linum tenue]|uniref:Lipase n=1 Tax=Linum tenue TaxID=586396 RepID=A0AAV0M0S3_9ROSI|nr:unnamed protein product [Linum tenue]